MGEDDLKILIAAEIDEDESASRIVRQLPSLAKAVNAQSSIKIAVSFDESTVQSQAQRIAKQAQSAVNRSAPKVQLDINSDEINRMVGKLKELKIPTDTINEFVNKVKNANVVVQSIDTSFKAVDGVVTGVSATVKGINEDMKEITQTISTNRVVTGKGDDATVSYPTTEMIKVRENYEQIEAAAEKAAETERKANDSRIASLTRLAASLETIHSRYTDINAPTVIKQQSSLDSLDAKYAEIIDRINTLKNAQGALSKTEEAGIRKSIQELSNLYTAYKHLENVATKLRNQDVTAIKVDQGFKLEEYTTKLENAGLLTDDLNKRIENLKTTLGNVTDRKGLSSFLDSFGHLKSEVSLTEQKLKGLNGEYTKLEKVSERIKNLQIKMLGVNSNSQEYDALQAELNAEQQLASAIQDRIAGYGELAQNCIAASQYTEQQAARELEIATATAHMADKTAETERKATEQKLTYLSAQENELKNIQASYANTSKNPILDVKNLQDANGAVELVRASIDALRQSTGGISADNKDKINGLVNDLKIYIKSLQDTESAARSASEFNTRFLNSFETKADSILGRYSGITVANGVQDVNHLADLDRKYDELIAKIDSYRAVSGKLTVEQQEDVKSLYDLLSKTTAEYQVAEKAATQLRTQDVSEIKIDQGFKLNAYEADLKSAGLLTDDLRDRIESLRRELGEVTNRSGMTKFLDDFGHLKAEVAVTEQELKGLNAAYTELGKVSEKIKNIQIEMLNTKSGSSEYAALKQELTTQLEIEKSIKSRIAAYGEVNISCAKSAQYIQEQAVREQEVSTAMAQMADKAAEADRQMQTIGSTITGVESRMRGLADVPGELSDKVSNLRVLMEQVNKAGSDKEKVEAFDLLEQEIRDCNREITNLNKAQSADFKDTKFTLGLEKAQDDLVTTGRTWSALFSDGHLQSKFNSLAAALKNVNNQMDLKKWTAQFSAFKSEVKAAGKNMLSFGDTLKNNLAKVTEWVSATTMLFRAFRILKSAVTAVIDLDTAMVDLRKTTDETEATYQRFYETANDTAKALGVTTEAIIAQTAEWSRLGYTLQDAAKMAENSAKFAAISPELSTEEATDGLISIMKAYDLAADEMLDGVISKINKLGNEMAVSNKDLVDVMTRASSAMSAANNSFEETLALATAATEITRDADTVGNALKTLSMRIRGYDESTEEYSEDVAILTGEIADLTKVASNSYAGVSLFEADNPEQYRSTYEILKDIAAIWDELTDKNRATLLETLFGKRQGQVGSAILSNFESAESAMVKMANAAGNADAEMEKIYDSLEYKLNALQEMWVGVAQNLVDDDLVKGIVDILTTVSGVVDTLTEHLGLLGTIGVASAVAWFAKLYSSVGGPNMTGLIMIAPTYTLAATRNELAA